MGLVRHHSAFRRNLCRALHTDRSRGGNDLLFADRWIVHQSDDESKGRVRGPGEHPELSGTLIILVATGFVFARLLTLEGIPQALGRSIAGVSTNPVMILLIIMFFMVFIGTWAETFSQIIVLTPIFLPVVMKLGVDPIHFGVLFVVTAEIGFLTPPFGANLFVGMKIADISLETISKSVLPYILIYLIVLVILVLFPEISLFLPRLLFGFFSGNGFFGLNAKEKDFHESKTANIIRRFL